MSTSVEKIKERLNIVDLLSTYIKLEKAGKNLKAKCPFHNEKTPSFFVSLERDSYYCFGCGAKGDIFTFVQEFEGLDFFGALKLLAERTGVELTHENIQMKNEKEAIFNCLEATTQFFESNLPKSSSAKNYLKKRGLTEKTIKDWRIGFVADDWRNLYDYLTARKFSDKEIEQAGLIKRNERSFYDRFRGRIMFPITDSASRIVGFTGRILPENDDGNTAKYLNSPETAIFHKSEVLYGFDKAKTSIRKLDYSVLVEGQMDVIMCHQAGFTNTVATSGTAASFEKKDIPNPNQGARAFSGVTNASGFVGNLSLLKRISNRIILAFDSDKAGLEATKKAELALRIGMEVKVADILGGKDAADIILKDKELWKGVLKDSMHIIDFYLTKIMVEKLDERKLGKEIREKILPFLALIESSIEKSHFVKKIADKTGIDEKAIWEDLKKIKVEPGVVGAGTKITNFNDGTLIERKDSIERRILGIINWLEKDFEKIIDIEETRIKVKEIIGDENFKKLMATPELVLNEATFEAEQYYEKKKIQGVIDELLMELEKEYITKKLTKSLSIQEQDKLIKRLAKLK